MKTEGKINRLKAVEQFKLTTWLTTIPESELVATKQTIAERASVALGFKVSAANIRMACEAAGVVLKAPPQVRPPMTAAALAARQEKFKQRENNFAILTRATALLYAKLGEKMPEEFARMCKEGK